MIAYMGMASFKFAWLLLRAAGSGTQEGNTQDTLCCSILLKVTSTGACIFAEPAWHA